MSISLDMLVKIKGGMSMLRLYLAIKVKYSGKVKWSTQRGELEAYLGVSASNLRNIKSRAIKLGILQSGSKDWIFAVGNKKWIEENDVVTKRKVDTPAEIHNDSKELRTYINSVFISNVVREYGTAHKMGDAVMPCSISFLERTLGWSRYRVIKYRRECAKAKYIRVEKDWNILVSTDDGWSEKQVKKMFTNLKKSLPHLFGEEFKFAKIAVLFKKKGKVEICIPSSSIIYTGIRTTRA